MTAANPLSVHRVSRMKIDAAKKHLPIACVGSLEPPGYERRSKKLTTWKPFEPIDPKDQDYDRSKVKLREDDREILKPNLSGGSDEDDSHSSGAEYGSSDQDEEENENDDTRGRLTRETGDLGEESYNNDADDDDSSASSVESSSDSSDGGSSGSDEEKDGDRKTKTRSRRRRHLPGKRDCASDDEEDDIWRITDEVLKISDSCRKLPGVVLKISDGDFSTRETGDEKNEEKLKKEREELLIFGRIREPNNPTTQGKGSKDKFPKDKFPRGTKKFNPCHINRSQPRHPGGRGNFRNTDPTYNRRPTRRGKPANPSRQTTPRKETQPRIIAEKAVPLRAVVKPQQQQQVAPPPQLVRGYRDAVCANQNNNKTSTYADVCRRSSQSPKPPTVPVISRGKAPIPTKRLLQSTGEKAPDTMPTSKKMDQAQETIGLWLSIPRPTSPSSEAATEAFVEAQWQKKDEGQSLRGTTSEEYVSEDETTPTSDAAGEECSERDAPANGMVGIEIAPDDLTNDKPGHVTDALSCNPSIVGADAELAPIQEEPSVGSTNTEPTERNVHESQNPPPEAPVPGFPEMNFTGSIADDPAILCVTTNPPSGVPHGFASPLHQPTIAAPPLGLVPPSRLPPPGFLPYDNNPAYSYTNYVYSLLNQLHPQDLLRIIYELKLLEAMNINFNPTFMPSSGDY